MKLSFALMLLTALLATGCGTRERVVERPVVVAPAAAGATAPNCVYASQIYSHGSISCQDRAQYVCNNGVWNRTPNPC